MAAVANGLAAFHPGTFLPVTSTFSMFYLYVGGSLQLYSLIHISPLTYFQLHRLPPPCEWAH